MKKHFLFFISLCAMQFLSAQENGFHYDVIDRKGEAAVEIDFSTTDPIQGVAMICVEPANGNKYKMRESKTALDLQRAQSAHAASHHALYKTTVPAPQLQNNFNGNITQGTPNDNDLAVSNGGFIISAVNTNINIFNDTGKMLTGKLLSVLGNKLGPLDRTYDPRVIYDPETDRFI